MKLHRVVQVFLYRIVSPLDTASSFAKATVPSLNGYAVSERKQDNHDKIG